jgi:hypothetical protein
MIERDALGASLLVISEFDTVRVIFREAYMTIQPHPGSRCLVIFSVLLRASLGSEGSGAINLPGGNLAASCLMPWVFLPVGTAGSGLVGGALAAFLPVGFP